VVGARPHCLRVKRRDNKGWKGGYTGFNGVVQA